MLGSPWSPQDTQRDAVAMVRAAVAVRRGWLANLYIATDYSQLAGADKPARTSSGVMNSGSALRFCRNDWRETHYETWFLQPSLPRAGASPRSHAPAIRTRCGGSAATGPS